eukprot:scaffold4346_cov52-Attheya_sp.AAC.1
MTINVFDTAIFQRFQQGVLLRENVGSMLHQKGGTTSMNITRNALQIGFKSAPSGRIVQCARAAGTKDGLLFRGRGGFLLFGRHGGFGGSSSRGQVVTEGASNRGVHLHPLPTKTIGRRTITRRAAVASLGAHHLGHQRPHPRLFVFQMGATRVQQPLGKVHHGFVRTLVPYR